MKKNPMKKKKRNLHGFAKDFTGSRSNSLSKSLPFQDERIFLFISHFFPTNFFFFFFLLMSPIISLVENKRTDIDGIQHRGEIHASLMEMNVSLTSRFVALKLNHATIVEGSAVLTSTAISKNNLETKVVQFPLEEEMRKITRLLKLF